MKNPNVSLEQAENSFIDRIGAISKQWGLTEPVGRVWAVLMLSEIPLTQKDIAGRARYSLSLVSPCISRLESFRIIRTYRGKGKERRYELAVSLIESFERVMKKFTEEEIRPIIDDLQHVKDASEGKKRRLGIIIAEYKRLEKLMDIFYRILFLKAEGKRQIDRILHSRKWE